MFNALAFNSSGLSFFACIPNTIASIFLSILSGNQPSLSGNNPNFAKRDREGSKISSSEPVIVSPFLCKAIARLCMALPPMAIKW